MPAVDSIQTGAQTISSSDGTTIDVTVTSVDTSKALVMYTHRSADNAGRGRRHIFTAVLTTSTNLRFVRDQSSSATDVTLEWTIVEFTDADVQSGTQSITATSTSISITDVDESRAFVSTTMSTDRNNLPDRFAAFTAELDADGQNIDVDVVVTPGALDLDLAWQVVELPSGSATVQVANIALSTSEQSDTAAITSVDTTKTFIAHGGARTNGTNGNGNRATCQQKINSATEVQADRNDNGTTESMDATLQIVEFDDDSTVESGTVSITDTNTTPAAQPTFSEVSNGVVMDTNAVGNMYAVGGSTSVEPEDFCASITLDDPADGLTIQRVGDTEELSVAWFVVAWAGGAAAAYPKTGMLLRGVG